MKSERTVESVISGVDMLNRKVHRGMFEDEPGRTNAQEANLVRNNAANEEEVLDQPRAETEEEKHYVGRASKPEVRISVGKKYADCQNAKVEVYEEEF